MFNGGGRHFRLGGELFVRVRKHANARRSGGMAPHEKFAD